MIPHLYQGAGGALSAAFGGLVYGLLFLAARRNLWLPVLVHGVQDTVGVMALYWVFPEGLPRPALVLQRLVPVLEHGPGYEGNQKDEQAIDGRDHRHLHAARHQ
jgi:hypothetical protein